MRKSLREELSRSNEGGVVHLSAIHQQGIQVVSHFSNFHSPLLFDYFFVVCIKKSASVVTWDDAGGVRDNIVRNSKARDNKAPKEAGALEVV